MLTIKAMQIHKDYGGKGIIHGGAVVMNRGSSESIDDKMNRKRSDIEPQLDYKRR